MPLNKDIKKVLVIGSGPIVIGQAAEFDYAGAQACRVLKDAGLDVVLVNSNPATIMTDNALADEIYLEPLTQETVKRIIEKEHPDSILAGLGGQTGLTIAMQLAQNGYLEKMGVKLLGTNAEAIDKAEDRQLFRDTMLKIGQPVVPSDIANTVERAAEIAQEIGYPVIIRPAFTLGGAGGGVVYNEEELRVIAYNGLELSPINQILVERFIGGWKEIEFEVMRDSVGNVIAVCSMENFDPVGVHTGDSIVIAPAVTLSDKEYQMLRSASLDIITELGIEGGCNCQFARNPETGRIVVIEINPRTSRSSALASKATGFPIAFVSALLACGLTLKDIPCGKYGTLDKYYPDGDYIVIKFARWAFEKFKGVLAVASGVEFSKLEMAKKEILRQLEACCSGEISDYELESARGYLVSDLKIAMDSPGRLDDFYMGQILLESSATMQDLSDAIARVTKEEAAQAARALRLDTIYELQGVQA